jgi:hypothetical protein
VVEVDGIRAAVDERDIEIQVVGEQEKAVDGQRCDGGVGKAAVNLSPM